MLGTDVSFRQGILEFELTRFEFVQSIKLLKVYTNISYCFISSNGTKSESIVNYIYYTLDNAVE